MIFSKNTSCLTKYWLKLLEYMGKWFTNYDRPFYDWYRFYQQSLLKLFNVYPLKLDQLSIYIWRIYQRIKPLMIFVIFCFRWLGLSISYTEFSHRWIDFTNEASNQKCFPYFSLNHINPAKVSEKIKGNFFLRIRSRINFNFLLLFLPRSLI